MLPVDAHRTCSGVNPNECFQAAPAPAFLPRPPSRWVCWGGPYLRGPYGPCRKEISVGSTPWCRPYTSSALCTAPSLTATESAGVPRWALAVLLSRQPPSRPSSPHQGLPVGVCGRGIFFSFVSLFWNGSSERRTCVANGKARAKASGGALLRVFLWGRDPSPSTWGGARGGNRRGCRRPYC